MEFSANASSVKKEPRDAFKETIKMVEDDFYKFNEIVNQNLRIESEIEKQLEKEDKKCTFLKHTIGELKKQLSNIERLCTEQRNYIFDLQMELEHISSTIYEQMEVKRIAYPEEDAKPYREMVNLAQRMVDCVTNFKTIIQQNIDDCIDRNEEINNWKNTLNQLLSRISELTSTRDRIRLEIDQLTSCVNGRSLDDINTSTTRLQEINQEFKTTKISHREVSAEKNKLNHWKQQVIAESTDKKTSYLKTQENFKKLKQSSSDRMNLLRTEICSTKQQYHNTIKDMKTSFDPVENEFRKLESLIKEKSAELEDMIRRETASRYEEKMIFSDIERMGDELSKIEESNEVLEKQEKFAKHMYDSMKQHTNALKTSISEKEICLRNVIEKLAKLESDSDYSPMDCDELNDTPKCTISTDHKNVMDQNDQLARRHAKLMRETQDLYVVAEELKFKLNACDVEIDFLNLLHNKISVKMNEEQQKVDEEMNNKIEKCIENVTELSNILMEKNLLLDSVRADVQKCFNLVPSLKSKIKTQEKENADCKTKLSQLEEKISNDEKISQNKANLLKDLEKNTFPKTRIPAEWLQSLQQQKNEYEKLKAERMELEEKRNEINVEKSPVKKKDNLKLSEIFTDTDPKKRRLDSEMKCAAYKLFKEVFK
ncbi:A-kinase anchor protein 9-like isoform X2 [Planococcus citri]|uniref:A-kinase anchor protein 9-like isoform X2 n=1 Tax=Planococcus citri TaxID=170843 RepID=UPI0031F7ED11